MDKMLLRGGGLPRFWRYEKPFLIIGQSPTKTYSLPVSSRPSSLPLIAQAERHARTHRDRRFARGFHLRRVARCIGARSNGVCWRGVEIFTKSGCVSDHAGICLGGCALGDLARGWSCGSVAARLGRSRNWNISSTIHGHRPWYLMLRPLPC